MASPLEIKIALHYWSQNTIDYPNMNDPAPREILFTFSECGLLKRSDDPSAIPRYTAGPALKCYVSGLMSIPFPVQHWVLPPITGKLGGAEGTW